MSHVIQVSDDAYQTLAIVAEARQKTPEALIEEFAQHLGERPIGPPMDADEFAHALGFTDEQIAQVDQEIRREHPELIP